MSWYFIFLSYVSIVPNPKSYYLVIYNSKLKLFSCYWGCIHTMDRCSIPQWSTRAPPSVPPLAPHSHYPQGKLPQWLFFYTKQRNQEWIWQNNNIECFVNFLQNTLPLLISGFIDYALQWFTVNRAARIWGYVCSMHMPTSSNRAIAGKCLCTGIIHTYAIELGSVSAPLLLANLF